MYTLAEANKILARYEPEPDYKDKRERKRKENPHVHHSVFHLYSYLRGEYEKEVHGKAYLYRTYDQIQAACKMSHQSIVTGIHILEVTGLIKTILRCIRLPKNNKPWTQKMTGFRVL